MSAPTSLMGLRWLSSSRASYSSLYTPPRCATFSAFSSAMDSSMNILNSMVFRLLPPSKAVPIVMSLGICASMMSRSAKYGHSSCHSRTLCDSGCVHSSVGWAFRLVDVLYFCRELDLLRLRQQEVLFRFEQTAEVRVSASKVRDVGVSVHDVLRSAYSRFKIVAGSVWIPTLAVNFPRHNFVGGWEAPEASEHTEPLGMCGGASCTNTTSIIMLHAWCIWPGGLLCGMPIWSVSFPPGRMLRSFFVTSLPRPHRGPIGLWVVVWE